MMIPLWHRITILVAVILFVANLAYLNYRVIFEERSNPEPLATVSPAGDWQTIPDRDRTASESTSLPDYSQLTDQIKQATASLTKKVDELSVAKGTSSPVKPPQVNQTAIKEYYIPLGTGSNTSTEWTDLGGVEAYVAPANYGQIQEMYFEASLRLPTGSGRVYARLKNVTDNNPLFESEVSHEGSGGKLVSSGKIPVPVVTKLYRVQLKSTLGAQANLDNGRIKLFVQ